MILLCCILSLDTITGFTQNNPGFHGTYWAKIPT